MNGWERGVIGAAIVLGAALLWRITRAVEQIASEAIQTNRYLRDLSYRKAKEQGEQQEWRDTGPG